MAALLRGPGGRVPLRTRGRFEGRCLVGIEVATRALMLSAYSIRKGAVINEASHVD